MNQWKLFSCVMPFVFMTLVATFSPGSAVGSANSEELCVTVEVFSGRPNPKFYISDAEAFDQLGNNLKSLPALGETGDTNHEFSRLGYRGIVIFNDAAIEGIPKFIQFLNGKVKIIEKQGAPATFYKDSNNLERYYLGLAKKKGIITDLIRAEVLPDPDSMSR